MALIKCPECGLSISDKAAACPNCGYPLHPAPEPVEYALGKTISDSKSAEFLRIVAGLDWIGGLIVAIVWGIAFDWWMFFILLGIFALSGGLIWCVSELFEDVHVIRTALSSLYLYKTPVAAKSSEPKP